MSNQLITAAWQSKQTLFQAEIGNNNAPVLLKSIYQGTKRAFRAMENLQSKQELGQITEATSLLTLSERRAFMKLPLSERRQILAKQAEKMLEHYESSQGWRELEAGEIIDY